MTWTTWRKKNCLRIRVPFGAAVAMSILLVLRPSLPEGMWNETPVIATVDMSDERSGGLEEALQAASTTTESTGTQTTEPPETMATESSGTTTRAAAVVAMQHPHSHLSSIPAVLRKRRAMQVCVFVPCDVREASFRSGIRRVTATLTENVTHRGTPVNISFMFAVGTHADVSRAMVAEEQRTFNDLAVFEDVPEGSFKKARRKSWRLFNYAATHCPEADLVVKQDIDTVVDWQYFLPQVLDRFCPGKKPCELPLRRLYLGRMHEYKTRGQCASGALYGVSGDVSRFIGLKIEASSESRAEDLQMCDWVKKFERDTNQTISRSGLMRRTTYQNVSIHYMKNVAEYVSCVEDAVRGCNNRKGNKLYPLHYETFFLMPRRNAR
eukprot:TRINITY_DN15913_c0_g1_i1.p1 TRINITY_DN15913_c0_g1~~TRINITY_DN15913_c0_g1_i1.p1  ORF type:complete len:398 (-),score=29.13 TRINITY_DN15913_c0_g1_i1:522-1664(-)